MNDAWQGIISVALAIVGVAIVATLVSPKARTSQVIGAATQGFGYDLAAAVSPVTGSSIGSSSFGGSFIN